MIYFIRLGDVPQFLVGSAISIGFLLILVPVWIANPGLVSSPAALLVQLGFVVGISLVAAGPLCRWMKQQARFESTAPNTTRENDNQIPNSSAVDDSRTVSASPQRDKIERSASTVPEPVVIQDPNMLAESIAKLIGQAFSSSRYIELFGSQSFSDDWTVQDGLAVWYFFGTMALDIAAYTTINSGANGFACMCDKFLSKQWRMPQVVLEKFNEVRQGTAEAAFNAFMTCKSNADYCIYFSRCVNRIVGCELPFEGITVDLILKGYRPKTLDAVLDGSFSRIFMEATSAAKKLIEQSDGA
jgi:hypothetical protein